MNKNKSDYPYKVDKKLNNIYKNNINIKNKNILLVYPKYSKTFWSFEYILKIIGKKAAYPPLGL